MATITELEIALKNADKAGDMDAARKLAAVLTRARQVPANMIPDTDVPETVVRPPEPSMGDQVIGGLETAATLATGATAGTLGMIGGTLKGLAQQILDGKFGTPEAAKMVEKSAAEGMQALTYAPRTQAGQEQVQAVGETLGNVLPPVIPLAGELGAAAQGARAAIPAVTAGAKRAAAPVQKVAQNVRAAVSDTPMATPGSRTSAGAAGVDIATLRQAKAEELPVPIKLTEGQKTRQFEQQRFEREAAKDPAIGEPIRQRFSEQNKQLQQNLDSFVDMTGAEAPDLRSVGLSVDRALRQRAAADKVRIRSLYKEAEKSGEMESPVDLTGLADYINQNRAGRSSAPILSTIADELKVQEIGSGSIAEGNVMAGATTLKKAEDVRKAINRFAKSDDANDVRIASEMKSIIDAATEGKGGDLYQQARTARARYAQNYENIGLIKNLMGQKRGTADRAIAMEDVLKRSIIDPSTSLDTVRQVRRLLQTEGPSGQQAWKELQGGTLRYIKDEATKNVARDELGNPIVSAAQLDRVISSLDKSGKLEFVFGKKGAEQLRTINDVAKDVLTAPPGSVNTSHTASVVLAALDMAISGSAGVPAPILSGLRMMSKGVKEAKTKARVKKALE